MCVVIYFMFLIFVVLWDYENLFTMKICGFTVLHLLSRLPFTLTKMASTPPPVVPRHSSYFPSSSPSTSSAALASGSPQSASPLPTSHTSSLRRLRDLPQHSSASVIKGHAGLAIRLSETSEPKYT